MNWTFQIDMGTFFYRTVLTSSFDMGRVPTLDHWEPSIRLTEPSATSVAPRPCPRLVRTEGAPSSVPPLIAFSALARFFVGEGFHWGQEGLATGKQPPSKRKKAALLAKSNGGNGRGGGGGEGGGLGLGSIQQQQEIKHTPSQASPEC